MKKMRMGRMPRGFFVGMALMGLLATTGWAQSNTPPTPIIVSAAMREGTTLMDVVYRVNDPDDATVSAYPLAFVDGVRSFGKVLRPVTFEEGTETNVGATVAANTDHALVWNVAADWDIDLGQVKFEIICKDSRGLLPFEWLRIPATTTTDEMTISKNSPTDVEVLNALFYLYASGGSGMDLYSGQLVGNDESGVFKGVNLLGPYSTPFVLKYMNYDYAGIEEYDLAIAARSGLGKSNYWHALNSPYTGGSVVIGWGRNPDCRVKLKNAIAIAAYFNSALALQDNGRVASWGSDCSIYSDILNITKIAAGHFHGLALKDDGTVVGWGFNLNGQLNIPANLTNAIDIDGGWGHSLALKSDGKVVGWGNNDYGQISVPAGLTGVTQIAAGEYHSLALKGDGTLVAWGQNDYLQAKIPAGLINVTQIAAGEYHSLALKSDGTLVAWGLNSDQQVDIPENLSNVTAIAAGFRHNLALKSDGTVVAWGNNGYGKAAVPAGLSNVIAIAAGEDYSLALKETVE